MMEKLAQAGEGGGARPTPFTISTVPSRTKLWCTLPLRGKIHPQLFLLYPYPYSVVLNPKQYDIILYPWDGVRGGGAAIRRWRYEGWHHFTAKVSAFPRQRLQYFVICQWREYKGWRTTELLRPYDWNENSTEIRTLLRMLLANGNLSQTLLVTLFQLIKLWCLRENLIRIGALVGP